MSYPEPAVSEYLRANFILHKAGIEKRESWPLFRTNHIIWTPSVGFADRNGAMHYSSPGFMPPSEFVSVLKIGRARCLMAWTRSSEAIKELETAAPIENAITPEVLFWLSVAYFLERRDTTKMYELWETLRAHFPDSPWAMRTYDRPGSQ